ncbi:hypothetical protein Esti_002358 [Eimeria stiedai]
MPMTQSQSELLASKLPEVRGRVARQLYLTTGTHDSRTNPCPPGTYNPNTKSITQDDCALCPEGTYCSASGQTEPDLCPPGHYCAGAGLVLGTPCPIGTYNSSAGSTDPESCKPCPAGSFCPAVGTTTPRKCPGGTYNGGEAPAASCQLCPAGTACPIGSTAPVACSKGEYSERGALTCEACEAGYYCDKEAMAFEEMIERACEAGLSCTLPGRMTALIRVTFLKRFTDVSSHTWHSKVTLQEAAKPTLQTHGCPAGHYCTGGVSAPLTCPAGTYRFNKGAASIDQCLPAPPGMYVDQAGATQPSGSCLPGYYCPAGSSSATAEICPAGERPLCALRIFSVSVDDCSSCPAGYFCAGTGLSAPSGLCRAGFICFGGSTTPVPTDGVTGSACDFGGYCPAGATLKQPCLPGTYNPNKVGQVPADCVACPAGYYCEGTTSTSPSGPCEAGFICTGGASNPKQKRAPKGHYAKEGAATATRCPAGTYNPNEGQAQCRPCDAGFYCPTPGLAIMTQCPAGYYCEEASEAPTPCPEGTLSSRPMQPSIESCRACPSGYYCIGTGNQVVSGTCDEGFYCAKGSREPRPKTSLQGTSGPCPQGAYCTRGVERPHLCLPGTYSSSEHLSVAYQCTKCTEGMYCSRTGLTQPEGTCAGGYICPAGSATPYGIQCSAGSYCPAGAMSEIPCPAGTFSSTPGSTSCQDCPAGYFCSIRTASYLTSLCPRGSYCPGSDFAVPVQCPAGTFGPYQGLKHKRQCQPCLPPKLCMVKGSTIANDSCPAGSYCTRESGKTDSASALVTPCAAGSYCPAEAPSPIQCPRGKLCTLSGLSKPDMPCPAGYLCLAGISKLESATMCPLGFVCVEGSVDAQLCPRGTIGTISGLGSKAQCRQCPGGQYCDSATVGRATGPCKAGFYCSEGSTSPWGELCPKGSVCPAGSYAPRRCPVGYSTLADGSSECTKCPAGTMCIGDLPEPCKEGFYCEGNAAPQECPAGTYMPFKGATSQQSCLGCPGGYACPKMGTVTPSVCEAGHFCIWRSTTTTPSTLATLSALLQDAAGNDNFATEGGAACAQARIHKAMETYVLPKRPGDIALLDTTVRSDRQCQCRAPALHHWRWRMNRGYYINQAENVLRDSFVLRNQRQALPEHLVALDATAQICIVGSMCGDGVGEPQESHIRLIWAGLLAPHAQLPSSVKTLHNLLSPAHRGTTAQKECKVLCLARQEPIAMSQEAQLSRIVSIAHPASTALPRGVAVTCRAALRATIAALVWELWAVQQEHQQIHLCTRGVRDFPIKAPELAETISATACQRASRLCRKELIKQIRTNDIVQLVKLLTRVNIFHNTKNYYCPEGSWVPTPCPSGTGHTRLGASSLSECLKCGAGVYCSSSGLQKPCDEGFVCYGASTSARPSDGTKGIVCPIGYFCPHGTPNPRICPIGTFGPTKGLGSGCDPCPAGRMCETEGIDTSPSKDCRKGHYCPEGSISPRQCPVGTYNDIEGQTEDSACLKCPPGKCACTQRGYKVMCTGKYCGSPGLETFTGDCAEGTWCIRGSEIIDANLAYLPASVISCPAGYTCPEGAIVPIPCPIGTYKATVGNSECLACPPGRYCAHEGVALPTGDGLCSQGFYCRGGATNAAPTDEETGKICPKYKFCPAGSSEPRDCPPGTFNACAGVESCPACVAGFRCNNGSQVACEIGGFCPTGVAEVTPCGPGTIGLTTGLKSQKQCAECPAGKVCSEGSSKEDCPKGLLCLGGGVPDIFGSSIEYNAQPASFWLGFAIQFVGPCPQGTFCPAGTEAPQRCPAGLTTASTGASDDSECVSCASGYLCGPLISVPLICPEGYFCSANAENSTACPAGTYQNTRGATHEKQCRPCESGYFCPVPGMANYSNNICPWGHFCSEGSTSPHECPAGTFNNQIGTRLAKDCKPCPAGGFACSGKRTVRRTSAIPLGELRNSWSSRKRRILSIQREQARHLEGCPSKAYCPEKSAAPVECPEDFYCPGQSAEPIVCPPSHYCPKGTDVPLPCPSGYFCPGGSEKPFTCPAGTQARATCYSAGMREECCEACPAGTYSDSEGSTACSPCSAGHVCTGGATTPNPLSPAEGGYVCPPGYYCPSAALAPIACAPGTYRPEPGASEMTDCLPCEAGTYQRYPAMVSCESCGSNAVEDKELGSTTCTCLGENRVYQHSDKTCPCQARYVSYDHHLEVSELLDGTLPCQRLTSKPCGNMESRDHLGQCMSSVNCTEACGPDGGTFLTTAGICECARAAEETAICDGTCKSTLPTTTLMGSAVKLYDPMTEELSFLTHPEMDLAHAQKYCSMMRLLLEEVLVPCNVHFQRADKAGLHALYAPPPALWTPASELRSSNDKSKHQTYFHKVGKSRLRFAPANLPENQMIDANVGGRQKNLRQQLLRSELQAKAVDNSLLCVTVGSTIVWQLQDGAYPVYLEDSLLNSSSNFDKTEFRRLLIDEDEGKPHPAFFVHTFESEGTYVFASSLQRTKLAIVRVVLPGTRCPGENAYPAPIRLRSLSLLAISITASDLILHPNWGVLVGVLVALVAIVVLAAFIVARFVWHRWQATRNTADSCCSLEAHQRLPLADEYKALTHLLSGTGGAAQIVHYRIRDELLDQTEQTPYDPVADVKPALDHLQVEIDVQDFRVVQARRALNNLETYLNREMWKPVRQRLSSCNVLAWHFQATLEKLCDMRETLTKMFAEERSRENETCFDTMKLVGQTLADLQQRLNCADLKGPLPVASHHVTALLRSILSILQGSGHSKEEAAKLYELERLQEQHGSEALATTWGGLGVRQADILRIYVSKAGSSVYDSLDAISKVATERRETLTECQKALAQLPLEENEDSEGGHHILLAAVHDLLAKRKAKIHSSSFKSLVSLYRHVDLAEHRLSEKEAAFLNLCNVCQQEMIGLQDLQSLRVLKWQHDYLMSKFTRNSRVLREAADPMDQATQEALTNLFTARDDQIASFLNGLCGSIAAILQQHPSVSSSRRAKPPFLVEALQELQEIRQQQDAQIKTNAEKQMELLRSSLQSYTDTAIKHSRVLASREKAALTKLSKALRKEVRAEYAAASAKATEASELQKQALDSAARSSQNNHRKTMNSTAFLLAGYAKLKGGEEDESKAQDSAGTLAAEHEKNRALEKLSEAFSRREKAVLELEAIRLEHHQSENEALMKTTADLLHLTERLKGMSVKTTEFAGAIASAETSIDIPMLRHMAVSRALHDLLLIQALPGSTKDKIKTFKKHQETAFQQLADTQLKKFQASHASTVIALKRLDDRYVDSLKKVVYAHKEEAEARQRMTMHRLHALERDQIQERLCIKTIVAQSTSKALLLGEVSASMQIWWQNQLKLVQASRDLQYDPREAQARMAEINAKAEECAKMLQAQAGSRLAEELSRQQLLSTREDDLLLQIHEQQLHTCPKMEIEQVASEVHEAEIHDATAFNLSLLLRHAGKKAASMVSLSSSSSTSVDAELATYSASWENILTNATVKRNQDSQKRKAAHVGRLRGLRKSNEATELTARKRQLQCAYEIIELQQSQGPMANEKNKFLHDLLHQLAARQADAQYRSQKALLDAQQEMTIGEVESELEKIELLHKQMQGTLTHSEETRLSRPESLSSESHLGVSERLALGEEAHSPGQGEEGDGGRGFRSASKSLAQSEAGKEKVGEGDDSRTEQKMASQLFPQPRTSTTGCLDLSGDLAEVARASARQSTGAEAHALLGRGAAGGAFVEDHDNLLEQLEEYLQHAEMQTDHERLIQDHRTQQLLYERRERLLKKKASLEAQQKKKLEELEALRAATLKRLEHQLLQDIFDFSIEFEVEVPELEKLARQLWNESQHRHQEKLQELEKKHTKKMELAYGEFLSEWAESHEGDVEASAECHLRQASWSVISKRLENEQLQEKAELEDSWLSFLEGKLKILAAKGCEVAKGYLDETKQMRERAAQFRQQRFEALRRAQADVQRDLEKKEAAHKAHVEERLKTVEAQWMQKLRETGDEEESKLWELQNLAEASFRERRRMIEEAAEAGRKGAELRTHVVAAKQRELLNELVADMHQLQRSLQVEKARQKAAYQRKLLEKLQRRKKFILRDATEGRKSLMKAALDQQQQVLGQLRQEQFLFSLTKTRQVALKFSQRWLAEARKHLRAHNQRGENRERRLHELSREEFRKKCSRVRAVLAKSMRQVESLIRGLAPERDSAVADGEEALSTNQRSQAAQLAVYLHDS